MSNNKCEECGKELYNGSCIFCDDDHPNNDGGILPNNYVPGDPFW